MAVTISRTLGTDDDGSGTTGTVINTAWKTELYNQIDAALAALLPLAGGTLTGDLKFTDATYDIGKSGATRPRDGFFSRNVTVGGVLTVSGSGSHTFSAAGPNGLQVTGTGTSQYAYAALTAGTTNGGLTIYAQSWGVGVAARTELYGDAAGGISVAATHASGAIRFYSGGSTERGRFAPSGKFLVGTTSLTPGGSTGGAIVVAADGGGESAIVAWVNSASSNNLVSLENTNGQVGRIQVSGTTTSYLTTSDARLKHDRGAAHDLAALRAVVIHDFDWTVDGTRDRGVFAQEAQIVFPRAVTVGRDDLTPDGNLAHPWMTDYSKFVPDLIVGWQQHDAALHALEARIAHLEGRS